MKLVDDGLKLIHHAICTKKYACNNKTNRMGATTNQNSKRRKIFIFSRGFRPALLLVILCAKYAIPVLFVDVRHAKDKMPQLPALPAFPVHRDRRHPIHEPNAEKRWALPRTSCHRQAWQKS